LREMSKRFDYYNPEPVIPALHRIFMTLVERFGKVYELVLLCSSLKDAHSFQDMDMAYPMLIKGKLKPFPHFSHGAKNCAGS